MVLSTLDGKALTEIIRSGALNLREHYEEVDKLNVFPVPDGDTGTNMCRTIEAGVHAIEGKNEEDIGVVGKDLSKGMLLGARGNSGVILSQIFRGICKSLHGKKTVNVVELALAYQTGVKQAYGAVVTPVEGTILTVFREATEYAKKKITEESTINDFFKYHLEQAVKTLANTKNILPVLKEADVIDSGGAGYVYIIKGIIRCLDGEVVEGELSKPDASSHNDEIDFSSFGPDDVLKYGYCTEFILQLQNSKVNIETFDVNTIIDILHTPEIDGDSIVALMDGSIVKVHVHTMNPGIVLQRMRDYGEFLTLKVENMTLQHNENIASESGKNARSKVHKKYAIVAVAQGEGIKKQFQDYGVDYVINGSETMNPSTEDFIRGFKTLDADNIIVFPNNKNVIMAAKQAANLYRDANVEVVMSTSIPQCYSALTMLDFTSDDLTIILGNFNEAIRHVTTGEITYAIRTTKVRGVYIRKGDYLAIINGKIVCSIRDKNRIVLELLKRVENINDKEVITLIYGKDVTSEDKIKVRKLVGEKYPHHEIGEIDGGQNVYRFLIAIE